MAKSIAFSGIVVGKYVLDIWENNVKTDKKKYYIQLLDAEKNERTGTKAELVTIKVKQETYESPLSVLSEDFLEKEHLQIDVREFEMNDKIYYGEIE